MRIPNGTKRQEFGDLGERRQTRVDEGQQFLQEVQRRTGATWKWSMREQSAQIDNVMP